MSTFYSEWHNFSDVIENSLFHTFYEIRRQRRIVRNNICEGKKYNKALLNNSE